MAGESVFHSAFKSMPFWWEAYHPTATDPLELPPRVRVAIVGGGYAGLSTALELAKHDIDCVVLEAAELGFGASTRNGGAVSGGVNIGKSFSGRSSPVTPARSDALLHDAADAFGLIERLIAEEAIECHWQKTGRFVGAWTPKHFAVQNARVDKLNAAARSECRMVPRDRQREEIASDYYYGGMVVERSANLHPALYYKGLLDACRRRGVPVCARAPVTRITERGRGVARVDQPRRCRGRRGGDRNQRLYRRHHAGAEAAGGPAGEPHHRHRTFGAGSGGLADPEATDAERYPPRAVLLPDVARRHADDFRWPSAVYPGDAGGQRADPASVHDRPVSADGAG